MINIENKAIGAHHYIIPYDCSVGDLGIYSDTGIVANLNIYS